MNIHEAKTHFSRLVAEVELGREVVITRAGRPVAKLVPYAPAPSRVPGGWEGRVHMAPDLDAVDGSVVELIEGPGE